MRFKQAEPTQTSRTRPAARMRPLVVTILGLLLVAGVAQAHTSGGDYSWNFCYGSYWSEPFTASDFVEAGMDDNPMSSSLKKCKASQVNVRLRDYDNTWYTLSDYDSLLPLGVEVQAWYHYISYTQHKSKESDNTWWTKTVTHGHY